MSEQNYVIEEPIAVLATNPKTNWTKEINLVSWYGREAKYDIRDWAPNREKYGKGVTLNKEEFDALVKFSQGQLSIESADLDIE